MILELLHAYYFAPIDDLEEMFAAALEEAEGHQELLSAARKVAQLSPEPAKAWNTWVAIGFLLAPVDFRLLLTDRMAVDNSIAWPLRNFSGASHRRRFMLQLSVHQAEVAAQLVGSKFAETDAPSGVTHGDENPWDAARFVHELFNRISAVPQAEATEALERLCADPTLASYREHLLHALAQQRARRREFEFSQPAWTEAAAVFANGPPANVADLWALVVAQLQDVGVGIRSSNLDEYKLFLNVDSYGRAMSTRPEESCRDALLTILRPKLLASEVTAEPEGHMADDKRADIAVARPHLKVVIELKKDVHTEIWTAATEQLDRLYTRDPEAKGYGIFGVFWFGQQRGGVVPPAPAGHPEPKSASEMASTLKALLAEDARGRIAVVVIDVSPSASALPSKPARGRAPNPGPSQKSAKSANRGKARPKG